MKKKRSLWITLAAVACICVSMLFGSAATAKAEGEGQEYIHIRMLRCLFVVLMVWLLLMQETEM